MAPSWTARRCRAPSSKRAWIRSAEIDPTLRADRMENADAIARFEREMEAVGALQHPNIVAAYGVWTFPWEAQGGMQIPAAAPNAIIMEFIANHRIGATSS